MMRLLKIFKQPKNIIAIVLVVLILVLIAWAVYLRVVKHYDWAEWTGIGEYRPKMTPDGLVIQRGKTLWDLIVLLIVPMVLSVLAVWLNRQERKRDRIISNMRDETERAIATDRQQEQALQAYLDKIADLLINKNLRESSADDVVRNVARARTLTTLRSLDPTRRGILVKFIYESELIEKENPIIILSSANLENVELMQANLQGASLRGSDIHNANLREAHLNDADLFMVNLSGADLSEANLSGADLRGANLNKANLYRTNLIGANLSGANLRETNLNEAHLIGADLSEADFRKASLCEANISEADLTNADLTNADLTQTNFNRANMTNTIITQEQLSKAGNLLGTILPDGKINESAKYKQIETPT